jgi:hypothetical protein
MNTFLRGRGMILKLVPAFNFFKWYSGVQICRLSTAANNMSIVPDPGDYDDVEISGMISRGN